LGMREDSFQEESDQASSGKVTEDEGKRQRRKMKTKEKGNRCFISPHGNYHILSPEEERHQSHKGL
ncbi:hypothetical protein JRQ81_012383, partial [Phrynocephalus forsythii]